VQHSLDEAKVLHDRELGLLEPVRGSCGLAPIAAAGDS
jgi:hypothetical protein